LAAKLGGVLQALPARICKLLKRFFETGRGGDDAFIPCAGVLVAFPIQRRQNAFVELSGFFQDGLGRVEPRVFKAWQLRNLVYAGHVFDIEQHVFDGGNVTHRNIPIR
jgi:hypothetical protein